MKEQQMKGCPKVPQSHSWHHSSSGEWTDLNHIGLLSLSNKELLSLFIATYNENMTSGHKIGVSSYVFAFFCPVWMMLPVVHSK